jgi:hypothetical protein
MGPDGGGGGGGGGIIIMLGGGGMGGPAMGFDTATAPCAGAMCIPCTGCDDIMTVVLMDPALMTT